MLSIENFHTKGRNVCEVWGTATDGLDKMRTYYKSMETSLNADFLESQHFINLIFPYHVPMSLLA